MKINVETKNGIVESAFFKINEKSLSLYINTVEKWTEFDCVESSSCSKKYTYHVNIDPESNDHDFVELVAENNEEVEMLNRFDFLLPCKSQLWILMPHESVYS